VAVVTGEGADGPLLTEFSELPYNHLNRVLTLTLTPEEAAEREADRRARKREQQRG
jgi:hypothetical protein